MRVEFLVDRLRVSREEQSQKNGRFRAGGRGGSAESQLLHHVKTELRRRGFDVLKKRMHHDGHSVPDTLQCVRDRKGEFIIFNANYAAGDAGLVYNKTGEFTFTVARRPASAQKGAKLKITSGGNGGLVAELVGAGEPVGLVTEAAPAHA